MASPTQKKKRAREEESLDEANTEHASKKRSLRDDRDKILDEIKRSEGKEIVTRGTRTRVQTRAQRQEHARLMALASSQKAGVTVGFGLGDLVKSVGFTGPGSRR